MMHKAVFAIVLVATTSAAVGHGSPARAEPQSCFDSFNREFGQLSTTYPIKSSWGTRDTYQYSYFLGTEGIRILQKYRSCIADADFAANYEALVNMRDGGRKGCLQTTTDASSCVPQYPG